MTFMPWNDDFVTDIAIIDEQHHWLVDMTNQLHDEVSKPAPDRDEISVILEGLVDYTFNHFIVEEEMFQRFGYPAAQGHKAEHDKFTREVIALLNRHDDGGEVTVDTLDFLKDWLAHHILVVDKGYVPFLKGNGVS